MLPPALPIRPASGPRSGSSPFERPSMEFCDFSLTLKRIQGSLVAMVPVLRAADVIEVRDEALGTPMAAHEVERLFLQVEKDGLATANAKLGAGGVSRG